MTFFKGLMRFILFFISCVIVFCTVSMLKKSILSKLVEIFNCIFYIEM